MAYAIIRAGGHQEKVAPGEKITVDRLKQGVGEEVRWTPLVVGKDEGAPITDKKALEDSGAVVVGKVLEHAKADKIEIFQYRQKTGYRRHTGHRQPLTLVQIDEIRVGDQVFTAPAVEEPAEKPAPTETKKAAPKKKAAAKK